MPNEEQAPVENFSPRRRGGCKGCIRAGCGCFSALILVGLILIFWPTGGGKGDPVFARYYPASTMIASYSNDFDLFRDSKEPDLSSVMRNLILDELSRAGVVSGTISHLLLGNGRQLLIVDSGSVDGIAAEITRKYDHIEERDGLKWYFLKDQPTDSGLKELALVVLDPDVIAFGESGAIEEVVSVFSGAKPSLYVERRRLRPMISYYDGWNSVLFTFQDAVLAEGLSYGSIFIINKNPLFSLFQLQGRAFGARHSEEVCETSLSFQYSGRLPSTIVAAVFGFFAIFDATPVEIPPELRDSLDVTFAQDDGMATIAARFDPQVCNELDRLDR